MYTSYNNYVLVFEMKTAYSATAHLMAETKICVPNMHKISRTTLAYTDTSNKKRKEIDGRAGSLLRRVSYSDTFYQWTN